MRLTIPLILLCAVCSRSGFKFADTFHPAFPAPKIALQGSNGPYDFSKDRAENHQAVTLVFFGFTHCPDICPTTMHRLSQAMGALNPKEQARVRLLFITIDPQRDSPKIAGDYAAGFFPGFIGLSGSQSEIDKVKTAFSATSDTQGGEITHSSGIYWIDSEGNVRKKISQNFEIEDMTHDLKMVSSK